ncbi:MAG: O-antigen ligase family protein [bacterium]
MLSNSSNFFKKNLNAPNLLCLLVFLLPLGTAKHFVGSYSYINGYLVDYLVPAFYVSEFLVWGVIIQLGIKNYACLPARQELRIRRPLWQKRLLTSFAVLVFLAVNFAQAANPIAWVYRAYRLLEAFLLFKAASALLKDSAVFKRVALFFAGGVLWAGVLGLAQFVLQRPLFGYLPLGESQFQLYNPAVAKIELWGKVLVRAYSGFPHPNILAGYLVVGVLLTLETLVSSRKLPPPAAPERSDGGRGRRLKLPRFPRLLTSFVGVTLVVGVVALVATFSRTGVVALVVGVLLWLCYRSYKTHKTYVAIAGVLLLLLVGLALTPRFAESLTERVSLAKMAFEVWARHPIIGVGLNSFSNFTAPFKFQPVHNIFLLIFSEAGLLGGVLFLGFLAKILRRVVFPAGLMLIPLLFFGLFDHFLLTTYQGITLGSLTLAMVVTYTKYNGRTDTGGSSKTV